jgi:heme oxygenase (mycobilin-producing)
MPAPAAFRIMLRMQTIPGKEMEFEREWAAGAGLIAREPANRGQWLAKSAEEDGVYYIVSDWIDEPSFRDYEQSPRHAEHRSRLHPYRETGAMVTMNVIHEVMARSARR